MNESTLVPREEMSDLDWLALNVHQWPDTALVSVFNPHRFVLDPFDGELHFTHSQWLARRAELQNKPSWKDAPEWAHYLGMDEDGVWYWHGEEPNAKGEDVNGCRYWMSRGLSDIARRGELLGDWRDTLEKRPETLAPSIEEANKMADKFVPFFSVEDSVHEFNRIGDAVREFDAAYHASKQVDAATAKQPEPKGSGNPILGMVLADLTNRALEGKEKYGEPLLAHNGRNPLWDAYQEALDLAMYLRQAIEEQKQ